MASKLRGLSREEFQRMQLELNSRGNLSLYTFSDSMSPVVKQGQVLEIESIKDPKSFRKFDPIIFWHDGSLLCQYLWGINKAFMQEENLLLLTRPFHPLNGPDTPVPLSYVLGKPKKLRLSLWRKFLILLHALFTKRF